jgi:cytochrome c oxidase cbb3-type subunit II
MKLTHDKIERSVPLLIILVILVIAVGGLVEIVPLYFQREITQPVKGIKPYEPLRLAGRDIYIREGCYNCHSQMIRPFRAETLRYGHYSVAGEFVYDHPFQWGSKRTGPDLARVGATPTIGTASTSTIRATSFPNRTCRPIRGSRRTSSTAPTSRRA